MSMEVKTMDIRSLSQATDARLYSFIEEIGEKGEGVPAFLAPVIDMMCESCKYASLHTRDFCHNEPECFKSRYKDNLPELREELAEQILAA